MIEVSVFRKERHATTRVASGQLPAIPRRGDLLYCDAQPWQVTHCVFAVGDTVVDIHVRVPE